VVFDLESMPLAGRQPEIVQLPALDVDHAIARSANQVVMPVGCSVEAGSGAGMVKTPNDAKLDELLQGPVDGGSRKPRNTLPDGLVDLVGRGVVISLQDGLQYVSTLHGQRQSSLATQGLELLQTLRDVVGDHLDSAQMTIIFKR
jgi:hypothetical protein